MFLSSFEAVKEQDHQSLRFKQVNLHLKYDSASFVHSTSVLMFNVNRKHLYSTCNAPCPSMHIYGPGGILFLHVCLQAQLCVECECVHLA